MRYLLSCAAVLLLAAPAQAAVTDRAGLRGIDGRLPPALAIVLPAPQDYERGCCVDDDSGEWAGPRHTGGGQATLGWGVTVARTPVTPEQAARGSLVHGFATEVAGGARTVRHVIGGVTVGDIPAGWVLRKEGSGARFEGAVAFGISTNLTAVARFAALNPASEEAKVTGVSAADWNRKQIELALAAVYVDGSLPPRSVGIRRGARLTGTVRDRYSHRVVGAAVSLEKRVGTRWRRVRSSRTSSSGAFSLRPRGEGVYRVSASLGSIRARSRKVRAG